MKSKVRLLEMAGATDLQLVWNGEGVTLAARDGDGGTFVRRFDPIEWSEFVEAVQEASVDGLGDPRVEFLLIRGVCRFCGCTDAQACPEGCEWVKPNLCSQCAAEGGGP